MRAGEWGALIGAGLALAAICLPTVLSGEPMSPWGWLGYAGAVAITGASLGIGLVWIVRGVIWLFDRVTH